MGCDIHAHYERVYSTEYPNWWVDKGDAEIHRNYHVFALLAGVRIKVAKPLSDHRGLPPNLSEEVRRLSEHMAEDAHNHGWVTLAELKAADFGKTEVPPGIKLLGAFERREFARLMVEMEALKKPGYTDDDVRLVFFFDN